MIRDICPPTLPFRNFADSRPRGRILSRGNYQAPSWCWKRSLRDHLRRLVQHHRDEEGQVFRREYKVGRRWIQGNVCSAQFGFFFFVMFDETFKKIFADDENNVHKALILCCILCSVIGRIQWKRSLCSRLNVQ